jgi:hypothetical protein
MLNKASCTKNKLQTASNQIISHGIQLQSFSGRGYGASDEMKDKHEWQEDTNFKPGYVISALISDDHGICHIVTVIWPIRQPVKIQSRPLLFHFF